MMTPNASAGIRDAIIAGAVKLSLPLSGSLLSMIRCEVENPCKQGFCPICASTVSEKLREMVQSPKLNSQPWKRSAYALKSHVRKADDLRPIDMDEIGTVIQKTLSDYVRSFSTNDYEQSENYGCLAHFGLVEDTNPANRGDRVAVVEFVMTGGDDYEAMVEGLNFHLGVDVYSPFRGDLAVESVPIISTGSDGVLPDQGLLFGYTKRRLDVAERPIVISNKTSLAKMACNYGEHQISNRTFYRGLAHHESIVFDPHDFMGLDIFGF